ncbi:MAG: GNAT family N-acetyltransferase [Limnochordaceae bacterium]|nr:GNAT family N-acetyltransferase [Limnochordaceae bacterium]
MTEGSPSVSRRGEIQVSPGQHAQVARLLRQALWLDPLTDGEIQRQIWEDPGFEPGLQWGVESSDGQLVGFVSAVVRQERQERVGYIKVIGVHPQWRRQGIGSQLLERVARELQTRGVREVRVGGSAPCYLWAGVDVRYTEAFCLFQKMGYSRYSDAINMTVDLATAPLDTDEDEVRLRQHGIETSRLRPEEMEEVGAWIEQRFGPNWRWEVAATLRNQPVGCFLARQVDHTQARGPVVGFAAYGGNRRNWFGPMGTEPDQRHLGIGRTLLRLCLRDLREAGYTQAQISWTGPVAFYARAVNARMERSFWLMRKELAPPPPPQETNG